MKKIILAGMLITTAFVLRSTVSAAGLSVNLDTGAGVSVKTPITIGGVQAKGDQAISARITSMNNLGTRVSNMKYLNADQKAANQATLTASIAAMNTDKTKLDADTDLSQAKLDYSSIFKDNRIYMVVMPQVTVAAYANNVLSLIPSINTNLAKVQTRIATAQTAGKDVTAIQAQYSDAQAKLSDANVKATDAITLAGTLAVDHGDATIIASNKRINASIKADKVAIRSDIKAARMDVTLMKRELKALHS